MKTYTRILSLLIFTAVLFTACKSSNTNDDPDLTGEIYADIPANVDRRIEGFPRDIQDHPRNEEGTNTGEFTYYSLGNDRTESDSLSADWDIAFNNIMADVTLLANSGNGGGIQIVALPFDEVLEAPEDGYVNEIESLSTPFDPVPKENPLFIYSGPPAHLVTPNPDVTVVVKTPQGFYGKINFLHYYKGSPDLEGENFRTVEDSYYSFDYLLQADGSRTFTHEDKTTYFDLFTGEIVEDPESSQWNVGFNATTILGNTQNGGGVQLLNIPFDEVDEVPIDGYAERPQSNWYEYTMFGDGGPAHTIIPRTGKTIVVKTPEGTYAKFRVVSYYKGNPDMSSDEFANDLAARIDRHYTIEYAVREDGSRFFK